MLPQSVPIHHAVWQAGGKTATCQCRVETPSQQEHENETSVVRTGVTRACVAGSRLPPCGVAGGFHRVPVTKCPSPCPRQKPVLALSGMITPLVMLPSRGAQACHAGLSSGSQRDSRDSEQFSGHAREILSREPKVSRTMNRPSRTSGAAKPFYRFRDTGFRDRYIGTTEPAGYRSDVRDPPGVELNAGPFGGSPTELRDLRPPVTSRSRDPSLESSGYLRSVAYPERPSPRKRESIRSLSLAIQRSPSPCSEGVSTAKRVINRAGGTGTFISRKESSLDNLRNQARTTAQGRARARRSMQLDRSVVFRTSPAGL